MCPVSLPEKTCGYPAVLLSAAFCGFLTVLLSGQNDVQNHLVQTENFCGSYL